MSEKINTPSGKVIDLSGREYGFLTVEAFAHIEPSTGLAHWLCQCKCGRRTIKSGYGLRRGHIKSCGCLKKITGRNCGKTTTRNYRREHGLGEFAEGV